MAVLFVAGATVVGTWFFQDVELPQDLRRSGESSTFYYADGSTEAGGYGETLRKLVDSPEEIPQSVKDALIASEDRKFYEHSGVDYTGTMRALINNITGGETQGASTITQQYAGMVAEIRDDISYGRKAKEAVMAMKLEQEYSKDEILMFYLNLAYFGRGATGVEAAAQVYYDKPLEELTYAEAAYIVIQVKAPDGSYDPYYGGDEALERGQERWGYAMDAMVETGALSQAERDEAEFPMPLMDDFEVSGSWGGDTPMGFIVNEQDGYAFEEIEQRYGITKEQLRGGEGQEGGYSVTLTIDKDIQDSLVETGSRGDIKVDEDGEQILTDDGYWQFENDNENAALFEYDPSMTNAMVAIDPATGAVVGYYGGDDGFGIDKAGPESPHPPSSTFKMITAATAIQQGDSIESWFDASSPREFDSLKDEETETCVGGGTYPDCTLRNGAQNSSIELTLTDSVRDSKNTPMYSIAEHYGADTILNLASSMGLKEMSQTRTIDGNDVYITYRLSDEGTYTQHGQAVDDGGEWVVDFQGNIAADSPLRLDGNCNPELDGDGRPLVATNDAGEPLPADSDEVDECEIGGKGSTDPFYNHLAFGQYPTSVRDMAAMYATIANDGEYMPTHFVAEVRDRNGNVIEPLSPLEGRQVIDVETARDLQWVGSEIGGETETDTLPRDYFGKTGTWEASGKDKDGNDYPSSYNAHAWYVGAIPQLSIAAWVGNITSESDPISAPGGDYNNVFGSNTAYPVWFQAMSTIIEKKGDDEGWEPREWQGKSLNGQLSTWDIENEDGTIDPDSAYCGSNPDDPRCESEDEEEEEDEECEGPDVGECDEDGDDGELPPTDPGDEGETDPGDDSNCSPWFPGDDCDDDESPGDPGGGGGGDGEEPSDPEDDEGRSR